MSDVRHPREELKSIIETEKPEYVKELFDSISQEYDRMNWLMTGGLLALWHRAFARETRLSLGESALDVCCGTGDLSFIQARRVGPDGRVVGLDFSPNMLEIAAARAERDATSRAPIQWIEGDAHQLPFPDGDATTGFHAVTMGFALRNVARIPTAIGEMARVARKGGRIVCLEVSRPDHPLIRAGFNVYFFRIVPLLGRWAERRIPPESPLRELRPYTYLPYSLEHLPSPAELLAILRDAGLVNVRRRPLTGGVVSLYIGEKE